MHRNRFWMGGLSLIILALLVTGARLAVEPARAQVGGYTAAPPGILHAPDGSTVQLRGVNWFGFETNDHVVHGLWARNWKAMIAQMKTLGFNAVRLPFCPATLQGSSVATINYALNSDLSGKNSLQILDMVMAELDAQGFYILLDHHRPDCNAISELWYTPGYSEQQWIDDLVFVAQRYAHLPRFFGIDLKNEPHGAATWGTGNAATDWDAAAARAGQAVLDANPNLVIFVEGVAENPTCSSNTHGHWWGGNIEPLACAPVNLPAGKVVYSPHVYGPDVYNQPYFNVANFPANMPAIWEQHFGRFSTDYPIMVGEFGGRYGHGGNPKDKIWQDAFVDWMIAKNLRSAFYWSWNPNSGDTGGILKDDWTTVWDDKVALLQRLWGDSVATPSPTPPTATPTAPATATNTPTPSADWVRFGYIAYPNGGDWSQYSQLFDGTYTHVLTAFYLPNASGALSPIAASETFGPALRQQARTAGVKMLFSIGGSTIPYTTYTAIADNPTARQQFIDNVVAVIQNDGYDGVDFNFEGWDGSMTIAHRDKVLGLMEDTAQAVKNAKPDAVVTTALAALYYINLSATCDLINSDVIDWAHHMGYDFHWGYGGANGPWRAPGTVQWVYPGVENTERSVYGALTYLQAKGCDMRKITGGIPYFTTTSQGWNAVRNAANWESVALHSNYLEKQHPTAGYWVNDPAAVAAKVAAYRAFGLGGVMVWQVGHEGVARDLSNALRNDSPPPTATPTPGVTSTSTPTPTATNTPTHGGTPTLTATPPTATPPAGAVCTVHYEIVNDWNTGFTGNVRITNLSGVAWDGWRVAWRFTGNQQITNLWHGVFTQNGQEVEVRNANWNRQVAPGASVTVGFNAAYSGQNNPPLALIVNGIDCNTGGEPTPAPTPTPQPPPVCDAAYTITGDWRTGFVANVRLTNRGVTTWQGWSVTWTFGSDQRIDHLWNGVFTQDGQAVQVTQAGWNGRVAPGDSASFGFVGVYSQENPPPADLRVRVNGMDCTGDDAQPTPTPSPTPNAQVVCEVAYAVSADWTSGFVGRVTLTNRGAQRWNNWQLGWRFDGGQYITHLWNGNATQQGQEVTVTDAGWNRIVAPGESVSFGFVGGYSGANPAPTAFQMGETACTLVAVTTAAATPPQMAIVGPGAEAALSLPEAGDLRVDLTAESFTATTVALLLPESPPPAPATAMTPVGAYARLLLIDRRTAAPATAAQPFSVSAPTAGDAARRLYRWDESGARWERLEAGEAEDALQAFESSAALFSVAREGYGLYLPAVQR